MPTPPPIELKRHVHTLTEKETNEVVDVVADLIVNFLKGSGGSELSAERGQERTHERCNGRRPSR